MRRLAPLVLATLCGPVWAGGNISEGWLPPFGFNNRYWDVRQQPVVWELYPAPEMGYDEAFLRGPLEAAIATWVESDAALDAPEFVFGGLTTETLELDGVNSVVFGDLERITGISGAIASAPCTALMISQRVDDISDGIPGNGLGIMITGDNPEAPTLIVPVGRYDQGTLLECELVFNVLEHTFTTDHAPGTQDLQSVATHEWGHWFGLSHTPIPDATMYKIVTTNPPADGGSGMASLEPDDVASLAHIYKRDDFDQQHGTITGRVTIDGLAGDGVHVTALDAETLRPVAGRFSISWAMNAADRVDGEDFLNHGGGFYRLDGLPPGDYYVYAEWYDGTDERIGQRMISAPTFPIVVSQVATGDPPYHGELGFLPERFEFYNTREFHHGGNGSTPGSTQDNPDEARRITVERGETVSGIDIEINLDPHPGKPPGERGNPTGIARHDLTPITSLRAGGVLDWEGNGDDDYFVLRFPAAEMPEPPYNVIEGIWAKWGRSDRPYPGGLLLADPADPEAIQAPIVMPAKRLVTGWGEGQTGSAKFLEIRDRFNVTVNRPRDLLFVVKQPETPTGITYFSQGYFVMLESPGEGLATGRTLVTRDGFETYSTLDSQDVVYRVRTETVPPVMILGASPDTLTQGQTGVDVTISGVGFRDGAVVDFLAPSFDGPVASGVSVIEVTYVDTNTLEATVDVSPLAPAGPLDVEVVNPEVLIPNRSRVMQLALLDDDADGVGDAEDCVPGDATLWSVPGSVGDSVTLTREPGGAVTIAWFAPEEPGGTEVRYRVLRGDVAGLGTDFGDCFADDLAVASITDDEPLGAGQARLYLVAASNACGDGSYGTPERDNNAGGCPTSD